MAFLDVFKEYLKQDIQPFDFDKIDRWFSNEHEFVIDIYARELIPEDEIREEFFSYLNLHERLDEFKSKLYSSNYWHSHFKKLYAKICKTTLFGLTKYCQESEDWECPVYGDNVYRFEWFHFVIANEVDWGLMSYINPKIRQRNLLVSIPPQHVKTFLLSGMTPALFTGNIQKIHGIIASYNDDMANEILNRDFTPCVSSVGYSKIFPNTYLSNMGTEVRKEWVGQGKKLPKETVDTRETTRGGRIVSRGYIGVTGKRGGLVILDDPIKDSTLAMSQPLMDKINRSISSGIETRGNNRSLLILVQTRWVQDDPIGRALELDKKVKELKKEMGKEDTGKFTVNLCLRAFHDTVDDFPYDFRVERDQMLWESFQGEVYLNKKAEDDEMTYNALFQQRPISTKGINIHRDWIQRYTDLPSTFDEIFISVDTSNKDLHNSDRFALGVFGLKGFNYYLIDLFYERVGFLDGLKAIQDMLMKYPSYTAILIEEKSNGIATIATLRQKFSRVISFDPKNESKLSRFISISPIIQSGNLYVPSTNVGNNFISQLVSFTGTSKKEKDDLVDITTQLMLFCDSQFKSQISNDSVIIYEDSKITSKARRNKYNNVMNKNLNNIKRKYGKNLSWL